MNGFDPAVIPFGDASASIPPSRILRVGARLEEIMTYGQFIKVFSEGNRFETIKILTITEAYCLLLAEAGLDHNQRDVSQRIINGELIEDAGAAINAFYSQLSPQDTPEQTEASAPKKPPTTRRKKTKK